MKSHLIAAAAIVLASCAGTPQPGRTNGKQASVSPPPTQAGPTAERPIKAAIVEQLNAAKDATLTAVSIPIVHRGHADVEPISVAEATAPSSLLILQNNPGLLFSATRDQQYEYVASPVTLPPLRFPSVLRSFRQELYVIDGNGLRVFGIGGRSRRIPGFVSLNDFVVLNANLIAINSAETHVELPMITTIDFRGRRAASWSATTDVPADSNQIKALRQRARLAVCGDDLLVAPVYGTTIYRLDRNLRPKETIPVTFPLQKELLALANRPELVRPSESVSWLPAIVAGIACTGDGRSIFALMDLPGAALLEYNRTTRGWTRHVVPTPEFRRFQGLTRIGDDAFLTFGLDQQLHRRLVQLKLGNRKAAQG
jgi:hypothetical protein